MCSNIVFPFLRSILLVSIGTGPDPITVPALWVYEDGKLVRLGLMPYKKISMFKAILASILNFFSLVFNTSILISSFKPLIKASNCSSFVIPGILRIRFRKSGGYLETEIRWYNLRSWLLALRALSGGINYVRIPWTNCSHVTCSCAWVSRVYHHSNAGAARCVISVAWRVSRYCHHPPPRECTCLQEERRLGVTDYSLLITVAITDFKACKNLRICCDWVMCLL